MKSADYYEFVKLKVEDIVDQYLEGEIEMDDVIEALVDCEDNDMTYPADPVYHAFISIIRNARKSSNV